VSRKVTGTILQDNKEQMAYGKEEMIASDRKEPQPPDWLTPSNM
jgi:hypothetical protein